MTNMSYFVITPKNLCLFKNTFEKYLQYLNVSQMSEKEAFHTFYSISYQLLLCLHRNVYHTIILY